VYEAVSQHQVVQQPVIQGDLKVSMPALEWHNEPVVKKPLPIPSDRSAAIGNHGSTTVRYSLLHLLMLNVLYCYVMHLPNNLALELCH